MLVLGCSTVRATRAQAPARDDAVPVNTLASTHLEVRPAVSGMTLAYILKGDCPNWKKALAVATRKMGCNAGDKPPSGKCRSQLPCDVCQFLEDGAWPIAKIVDFPAKALIGIRNDVYGATLPDPRRRRLCPINDLTRVELKEALCYGEGIWGSDKVDVLAKAMVHEALHLCRSVGASASAMTDKAFWEYLICGGPDAEDLVEICWEAQD
jgi:hypothetical protein